MKVHAYVLAADPGWIQTSIKSYYHLVDKIVVTYDRTGRGFTGAPMPIDKCLDLLRECDTDGKMEFLAGDYALIGTPMTCETTMRRESLALASEGADWVLQLDTDEMMADTDCFFSCLQEAQDKGFGAMDFPARYFYRETTKDRFLERCSRTWGVCAGYPGALAIKANTHLKSARQVEIPIFRVDFAPVNTDPWRPKDIPVHRVIKEEQGIIHFSWVRSEEYLRDKLRSWSHSKDKSDGWNSEFEFWRWCGAHPYQACLKTPFANREHRLRLVKFPAPESLKDVWGR